MRSLHCLLYYKIKIILPNGALTEGHLGFSLVNGSHDIM